MGGFSDNYECGYWGDETPPIQKNKKNKDSTNNSNKKEFYVETSDSIYRYLQVKLIPIKLLSDEEQEERTNLTQLCNTETALKLTQNHKEIKIYYDDIFIGFVQKVFRDEAVDHTSVVDKFCFFDDELKDVEAFWSGDVFYFREKI